MGIRDTIIERSKKALMSPAVMRVVSDDRVMKAAQGVMDARTRVRAAWQVLLNGHDLPNIDPALDEHLGKDVVAGPSIAAPAKKNGANGSNGSNGSNAYETREVEDIVRPRNLASVGSRVSWSAVFAGVVVGAAVYTLLMTLAVAIGLSSIDQMSPKSFTVTAGIIGAVILLASMFLGGFIASRTTVGEQPSEAATYGILVWGAMTLLMLAIGLGSGLGYLGGTRQAGAAPGVTLSPELSQKLELTPRQQELFTQHYRTADVSPQEVAWWTFGGVAASLLAAIGGGLVGAGPQMVARPARDTRTVAVVPQPA